MKLFPFLVAFSFMASATDASLSNKSNKYIDQDGDEVVALDLERGEKIKFIPKIKTSTIYDNEIIFDENFNGLPKENLK